MKESLLQGNWEIEIQVSFKIDKICLFFFCFQLYQNV